MHGLDPPHALPLYDLAGSKGCQPDFRFSKEDLDSYAETPAFAALAQGAGRILAARVARIRKLHPRK